VSDPPSTRGTILIGWRAAALDRWGDDGLATLAAHLPADTRARTIDAVVGAQEWFLTSDLMAWHAAVFDGPARKNETEYRAFIGDSVDRGFWRVQRLLLKIATPSVLIERSAKLWRHYHTHGTLEITKSGEREVTGTLHDHPFATSALSRLTLTEALRHMMSMARAKNVRETHAQGPDPRTMKVRITWE
jgi:hypothetical protein